MERRVLGIRACIRTFEELGVKPASMIWLTLAIVFGFVWSCAADWSTQLPPNYVAATTANRSNIFFAGDTVQYALGATGVTSYEVRDYYGNLVESGGHDPASPALTLTTGALGWYKLYLYGSQDQGAPWHTVVGGSMFVVVRNNPNFPPLAAPDAPSGWYPDSDDQLVGFIGRGPQRLYVEDASNPAQAIQLLTIDLAILKQNYLPYDPVRKRVLAIDFPNGTTDSDGVRQIVEYFKNDVQYYEGRNEPNSETNEAFVAEEQAFYAVVKGVDPSLKVLGPSVVSIDPGMAIWIDGFSRLRRCPGHRRVRVPRLQLRQRRPHPGAGDAGRSPELPVVVRRSDQRGSLADRTGLHGSGVRGLPAEVAGPLDHAANDGLRTERHPQGAQHSLVRPQPRILGRAVLDRETTTRA